MIGLQLARLRRGASLAAAAALGAALLATGGVARAAADTVDEIHYSFGNTPDSVVFDWRGAETSIEYATEADYAANVLADAADPYGLQETATAPAIHPVDNTGPFQEVRLSGLAPGTIYHYRIGAGGLDHTFTTTPTDDFTWVDMGDTGTTLPSCGMPWMAGEQALVAAQSPSFVTHGGDISYANECGVAAVHQYFVDQQVWSESAAFLPAWGNHEYGPPTSDAPPGTPRDTLANYKGRVAVPNPQLVPLDTATRTSNPGCGADNVNSCRGEDWGWFVAGHVLFISYPEPWNGAYAAWEPVAQTLMDNAQKNPAIDFIVTYGHRPAYSSQSASVVTPLRTALTTLSQLYSPTANNPQGKYILNVAHHVHAEEVFRPIGGLVNITDGGGGAGQASLTTPDPNSIFRASHPGVLAAHYDATAHTLQVDLLCGPDYTPNPKYVCKNGYGSSIYSQTFTRPGPALPDPGKPPPATTQWVTNQSVETGLTGWKGFWNAASVISWATTDGYQSSHSVQVARTSGSGAAGFNSKPKPVTSTVAGKPYTASVQVKGKATGQVINLIIKETTSGGATVASKTVSVKLANTGWNALTLVYTAAGPGDVLTFSVYCGNLPTGGWFRADAMSLTSPN